MPDDILAAAAGAGAAAGQAAGAGEGQAAGAGEGAGEGAGQAAGAGAGAGEGQAAAAGGASAYKWEGLDADLEKYVGGRSPLEIARESLAHKQGATRRSEQILKDSGAMMPPEKGSEMAFFAKFAPEDVAAYSEAAKDELGANAGPEVGVIAGAAKAAGLHPAQFKALVGAMKEGNDAAVKAQGQAFEGAIAEAWGKDRAAHTEMVARAAKSIAPDLPPDQVIGAIAALNPRGDVQTTIRQLNILREIGARLEEGVTDVGGGVGGVANADEHKALKRAAIDAGGVKNLSSAQQKRLEELQGMVSNG